MTNIERIKKMNARELAEMLYSVSMCHVDETVFCGNCFIGAVNCDVDGITDWLVSEVE